jgi:hypothetical protein
MYATKIQMKKNAAMSDELQAIDQVYVVGNVFFQTGWYKPEFLHDYLKANPRSIQVNLAPFPPMSPAGETGKKFVMSAPGKNEKDVLLNLPRE